MSQPASRAHIHFGVFEVDPATGELRKHGIRIRLQDQPFQVLLALLERRGELVTREELRQRLWLGDTFVDFDQSLNRAINKVREALGDVSENPRFIETLPKRGYRFVAPVEGGSEGIARRPEPPTPKPNRRWIWITAATVGILAVAVGLAAWFFVPPGPPIVRLRQITTDSEPKSWPVLCYGSRVYFASSLHIGGCRLMQVSALGGRSTPLPFALPGMRIILRDLSPDGQELLMTADDLRAGPGPLWVVRVSDGSARRVGTVSVNSARYSPDGKRIAWSAGERLYLGGSDGSGVREIASMPGYDLQVRSWIKADRIMLLCSERRHPVPHTWEIAPDGSRFRRALPQWDRPHGFAGFTPDERFMLLLSGGTLWSLPVPRWPRTTLGGTPTQITFGTPGLLAPHRTRDGRLFTSGVVQLGELQRFDLNTHTWQRHLDGISADCVEYSRDGQWVAYVRYPERSVWRCRADGTQCLQLADGRLGGYLPHWSPDSKTIVFQASEPGKPWRLWLVNSDGGNFRLAAPGYNEEQSDSAWTADGKKIIFGRERGLFVDGEHQCLEMLDIGSGKVTKMPGTTGLWSPKSSPDRTRLLALSWRSLPYRAALTILDQTAGQWKTATEEYVEFPAWAPDNKSVIYHNTKAIRRFRLDTWTAETIASIDRYQDIRGNLNIAWLGQDPGGAPMVMRNRDVSQIYEIEFPSR